MSAQGETVMVTDGNSLHRIDVRIAQVNLLLADGAVLGSGSTGLNDICFLLHGVHVIC